MPTKKKELKWKDSKAKQLLYKDIKRGWVSDDLEPELVYGMRVQYQEFPLKNFKGYLVTLQKRAQILEARAASDEAALLANPPAPVESWDTSEAKQMLQKDIAAGGLAATGKPQEIWSTSPLYQHYPLAKFRNHLAHARRPQGSMYWNNKMNKKKRKRRNVDSDDSSSDEE
jgi:hypothetical protein